MDTIMMTDDMHNYDSFEWNKSSFHINDSFETANSCCFSTVSHQPWMNQMLVRVSLFLMSLMQIVVPCLHRGNSWMTHHGVCSSMQEEGDAIADIDSSWNDIAVSSSCQVCWFWILRWDTAWMTNWLTDWDSLKCCLRQLCWGHRFQRRCVWHIAIRVGTSQVVSSPPMGEPHCLISPMSQLSEWVDSDAQADLAWTRCARHI